MQTQSVPAAVYFYFRILFLTRHQQWLMLIAVLIGSVPCARSAPSSSLVFSVDPTTSEISNARIFDEPLIPMGGSPSVDENRAFVAALVAYSDRTNLDDFSSLTEFHDRFPDSKWSASLLLHLGVEYYNYGYYSRALDAWEQAWEQCKSINDGQAKGQADLALGELARMYSSLGRMNELKELLDSTASRSLTGPGTALIHAAKQALWLMQNRPDVSFRCGPMALQSILLCSDPQNAISSAIFYSKSSTNGFSLFQVAELSRQLGLNFQMAFRSPGADVLVPAVVHWKLGHYAALLERNGNRILVQDLTFGTRLWMSITALDEEASGYYLVPAGELPTGWRSVPETEGQNVWGRGTTETQTTTAMTQFDTQTGGDADTCPISGMTSYAMDTMLVSLNLHDTPVGYKPPVGPAIRFIATYSALEMGQATPFNYSNLGSKWTCNWISYINDEPGSRGVNVSWYVDGGGTLPFAGYSASTGEFTSDPQSHTVLVMTSTNSYELRYPDGSKKVFELPDNAVGSMRRIFLTQIVDPAGNTVQLNYDSSFRITNIVDAIGQSTVLLYTNALFPDAITAVVDPFGRAAYFQYNSSGLLSEITDVLGLSSQYVYGANDFVTNLITPYGTTLFVTGSTNGGTFLQATDPLGESELLEFSQSQSLGVPYSLPTDTVPHGMSVFNDIMYGRNSFFWGKKAFEQGPWNITNATIYHFCHEVNETIESPILETLEKPLESPIWYNYPGQFTNNYGGIYPGDNYLGSGIIGTSARPSVVGRVLDDGTSQLYYYQYNPLGNVANTIDPMGRNFTYVYSTNNVDLIQSVMTHNGKHEIQSTATYNARHLPLTITDAAGQTATNSYNARGQLLSTADPKGELTSFTYDSNGYLTNIVGPLQNSSDATSFTYDSFGRVHTATDTEGYTLAYSYDAADRATNIAFPDGTTERFVYSNLDLVASADRLGRWKTYSYNADRQLIKTQDPLGRVTQYLWCECGAMTGLIDPLGRQTTWDYDLEGRVTAKHYPGGTTISYAYENTTSRLAARIDEQGQETHYKYYPDNDLMEVNYPNAINPTPTVSYTYDRDYNRVTSMQDSIGTTTYLYNPITFPAMVGAGQLASVSGPLPDSTVTYQYDQLGRVVKCAINGVAEATTFDGLGRPIVVTNALGSFQFSFADATRRLASEVYPNGQTDRYSYYNNFGDERLLQIQHLYPNGSLLSAFGYAYNAAGQITAWTNQWDTLPTGVWLPSYDAADQLTNVVCTGGFSSVTNYSYAYDLAGNRELAQSNNVQIQFNYNALNQLAGAIPGSTNSTTYEWDAENRLTAINQGSNQSQFIYDGLGRRFGIVELTNGVVQNSNYYLWCGNEICEARDASGAIVLRRLFPQGESLVGLTGSTNYYYTRDHLGSVREAVGVNGLLATRYSYDPYGQRAVLDENVQTTLGFTGDFVHQESGLYLTWFRALDSMNGRWHSRDPLGEKVNSNLYCYVRNDPLRYVDRLGLCDTCPCNVSPAPTSPSNLPSECQLLGVCPPSTVPPIITLQQPQYQNQTPSAPPIQNPDMWPLTYGPSGYQMNGDYSGAVEFEKELIGTFIPEGWASRAWDVFTSVFDFEPSAY